MSNKIGIVKEIFSASKECKESIRPISQELECIKDFGIKNDKFAGKNPNRSVMIVGDIAYKIAKDHSIKLKFGSLGENILVDFDPHTLAIDEIISINKVQLQVTQVCSICSHLNVYDKMLPSLIKEHRGVYCKIVSNGIIKKGLDICKQ